MGKTTLCRTVAQGIDRRTVTSLVLDPVESLDDLLKTMLVDFGVMAREDLAAAAHPTRAQLTSTLDTFLESLVRLKASAVVFIDEAQHVPVDLLADLAATLAPGTPGAGVLRLVLVGQPSLTKRLKHPDLRGLHASIGQHLVLGPLAEREVSGYVAHRLSVAGGQGRIAFDEAAIAALYELSAGVPRVVNLLCDRALMRGQQASADVIDAALVDVAAADLDLQPPAEGTGLLGRLLIVAVFALLVLVGAAGALWTSRDAVNRTILQWEQIPLPPGGPVRHLSVPISPIPPPDIIPDNLQRRRVV
jgi:general secretion pathway protein A